MIKYAVTLTMLFAFIGTPASGQIALVSSTAKRSASSVGITTDAIDTTGANLVVAIVNDFGTETLSDSEGNTWTALTARAVASTGTQRIHYCINPTTSGTHTFTVSGTNIYPSIAVLAFSGVDSYESESGSTATATTTIQPGSITPTEDGALLVTGFAHLTASATINSGFTEGDAAEPYIGGGGSAFASAYLVQGTAAAINPTWTAAASSNLNVTMACFLPAASGPAINPISSSIPGSSLDPIRTTIP